MSPKIRVTNLPPGLLPPPGRVREGRNQSQASELPHVVGQVIQSLVEGSFSGTEEPQSAM